jgi:hypothetical protein
MVKPITFLQYSESELLGTLLILRNFNFIRFLHDNISDIRPQ